VLGLVTGEKVRDGLGESLAGQLFLRLLSQERTGKTENVRHRPKGSHSGDIGRRRDQGGTQVFDDMDCVLCERERGTVAAELMVFVNAVRIRLSDKLV